MDTFSIELNGYLLIFSLLVVLITIVSTLVYISKLRSRISSFEKPRFGFLGKTIYPFISILILSGVVFIAGYGIISTETSDSSADFKVEGKVDYKIISQTLKDAKTDFSFTPIVSGNVWGEDGDEFDVYWKIKGPKEIDEYELNRSAKSPSKIRVNLPKGTYNIEINLVYEGKNYTFNERITL